MGAILVTGATGFLGGTLCRALARLGADVVGTGRDRAKLETLGVNTFVGDLSKPIKTPQIGPLSAVVHCAALSSPWGRYGGFHAANVIGTHNALALAKTLGAKRFVHISTPTVYFRFCDQDDLAETTPLPKPINHYAKTKALAEKTALVEPELDVIALRPRGIYGNGDTALLPRMLRVVEKRPIPLFRGGQGATDITHVDDVVAAILAALEAPAACVGQIFNVSGGTAIPLRRIIQAACATKGITPRWRTLPFAPVLAGVRALETIARMSPKQPEPPVTAYGLGILRYRQSLDLTKARQLLGWEPQVDFDEGLRRTFAA